MIFQVHEGYSVLELFKKSRESVEIKERVASSEVSIGNLVVENYCDFIHISAARRENQFSGFDIRDLDDLDEEDDEIEEMIIGNEVFPHSEYQASQLVLYHVDKYSGALAVLKYLFEILKGPLFDFTSLTGTTPNPEISAFTVNLFSFDKIQQCEKVMMFENGVSSKNMIDQVLDLATGLKRLDLRCPLPDDWKNEKILNLDTLISWPSEWFTTTDLLVNLNCECVQLNETNLNWRAFKAFMLKWQMIEDTRLKVLEISFDGNWEGFQLDGLNLKDWDREERDSHYPDLLDKKPTADWFNCEFATDIQRSDGLLASFWRRENSFHFVVWHDRHPIATLRPNPEQLVILNEDQFIKDEDDDEDEDE